MIMNDFKKIEKLKEITTTLVLNKDNETNEANRLLCEVAPLVLNMACKYNSPGVDVCDLFQEGVLGVYDAQMLYNNNKYKLRNNIISQIPENSDFETFIEILNTTIKKNSDVIVKKAKMDKTILSNAKSQIMWVVENVPCTKFSSFAFFYIRNRIKSFKARFLYGDSAYYGMVVNDILLTEKIERDKNYEKLFNNIPQQDRRLIESYYGIGCDKISVKDLAKQNNCCNVTIYNKLKEIKNLIYANATKFNISISSDL